MRAELVVDLDMALARRRPDHGVIFHSDRGCQYTSADYATFARANGGSLDYLSPADYEAKIHHHADRQAA
jgi:transposase InsO family protein